MTFSKKTTRNLKSIIEEDEVSIANIYRVYYENSDIPLFLNNQSNGYENTNHNLQYGINEFDKLYLKPNCNTNKN